MGYSQKGDPKKFEYPEHFSATITRIHWLDLWFGAYIGSIAYRPDNIFIEDNRDWLMDEVFGRRSSELVQYSVQYFCGKILIDGWGVWEDEEQWISAFPARCRNFTSQKYYTTIDGAKLAENIKETESSDGVSRGLLSLTDKWVKVEGGEHEQPIVGNRMVTLLETAAVVRMYVFNPWYFKKPACVERW